MIMHSNCKKQQGGGVYNKVALKIYDPLVIFFENPFVWKCASSHLLEFYNWHISGNHLDVGVGSGYFLDRCRIPVEKPKISLLDSNPDSLQTTARRIRRYNPVCHQANVLEPLHLSGGGGFQTIGMNLLLNCLPGSLLTKGKAVEHLKACLNPGGTMFGSTILGKEENFGLLGRLFIGIHNARIFSTYRVLNNAGDDMEELKKVLSRYFNKYSIDKIGHVAFFAGYN